MGRTPTYLANNIFRLDAGSKLTEDKEYGINGFMNTLTLIKSRSARAGQTIDFVFNPEIGYDNALTTYHFLKKEGLVGGAGRSFYITEIPDVKFSQKDFKKKFEENKEFRLEVIKLARKQMKKFINTSSISTDRSEDPEAHDDIDIEKSDNDVAVELQKEMKKKK